MNHTGYPGDRPDGVARRLAYAFGLAAETWVALRYRARGYRILAHRFRSRSGEIDLVARRGLELAFVEVKARRRDCNSRDLVSPTAAERIRRTADDFMTRHPHLNDAVMRFDLAVVGVAGTVVHKDVL